MKKHPLMDENKLATYFCLKSMFLEVITFMDEQVLSLTMFGKFSFIMYKTSSNIVEITCIMFFYQERLNYNLTFFVIMPEALWCGCYEFDCKVFFSMSTWILL